MEESWILLGEPMTGEEIKEHRKTHSKRWEHIQKLNDICREHSAYGCFEGLIEIYMRISYYDSAIIVGISSTREGFDELHKNYSDLFREGFNEMDTNTDYVIYAYEFDGEPWDLSIKIEI